MRETKGLLERLIEHQRAVEAILDRSAPLLGDGHAADPEGISRVRWEMLRALTAYQGFKHREIFDPAIRAQGQARVMGEAMKADCLALGEAVTTHVQHWSRHGTGGQWAVYRDAAQALRTRIRRHLRQEERGVATLIRMGALTKAAPMATRR